MLIRLYGWFLVSPALLATLVRRTEQCEAGVVAWWPMDCFSFAAVCAISAVAGIVLLVNSGGR